MESPRSKGAHVGISLLAGFCVSVAVYIYVVRTHFEEYARQFPHDGQDGLAAGVDGLAFGGLAFVVTFGAALFLLRLLLGD